MRARFGEGGCSTRLVVALTVLCFAMYCSFPATDRSSTRDATVLEDVCRMLGHAAISESRKVSAKLGRAGHDASVLACGSHAAYSHNSAKGGGMALANTRVESERSLCSGQSSGTPCSLASSRCLGHRRGDPPNGSDTGGLAVTAVRKKNPCHGGENLCAANPIEVTKQGACMDSSMMRLSPGGHRESGRNGEYNS